MATQLEGKSLISDFFRFIIPSIVAQWVFALYTAVDGIFVARGVSEVALTAINISMPYTMTMFALSILLSVGASSIVAIRLGEKNNKNANEVFTQNFLLLIGLTIVVSILGYVFLEPLAYLLGATPYNIDYVLEYLGTIVPFSGAFIISYSFEIFIKTDGFPQRATLIVTAGVLMNVVLDYLMVIRWEWGAYGAALATVLANTGVVILYLLHFCFGNGTLKFCKFRFSFETIYRQIRNGLSSGITEFSTGLVIFIFNRVILHFVGEEALVSYTIISYVNSIVVMTMVGLSQGYQPLIGYYWGKKDTSRCNKLLKYGLIVTACLSLILGGLLLIGTNVVVGIYIPLGTELASFSATAFRIFATSYFIVGLNVVVSGYFIAIEKSLAATIVSASRSIVMLVASLYILTLLFGGDGIWWAAFMSECLTLLLTLYFLFTKHTNK